jgi:uncharacterized protein (TIGR00369 family)
MSEREKLQAMVDRSHFGRWWGLIVDSVAPDPVRVRVPARTELLRPGDVLHGACAMIAADVAVWVALCGRVANGEGALTVHLASDYLAPARGDIVAEARLLKVGKRVRERRDTDARRDARRDAPDYLRVAVARRDAASTVSPKKTA